MKIITRGKGITGHNTMLKITSKPKNGVITTIIRLRKLNHCGTMEIKLLLVTDGTLRIHYYTPSFDGVVIGTEDVLIPPFTCYRTGSGDAVVAAVTRKITICPDMFDNQDVLERQLRFAVAVAAGIISQWTIGAVRGFPTESATQNLKEQVYVPSMW